MSKNGKSSPELGPIMKKYNLPNRCSAKSFIMRELTADDETQAAIWWDKTKSSALDSSPLAQLAGEQREAWRLALVEVDGKAVNGDGIPFLAMNKWNLRTMRFVQQAFGELNGVDADEVRDFLESSQIVGQNSSNSPSDSSDQPTAG